MDAIVAASPWGTRESLIHRPWEQRLLLVGVGCLVFGLNLGATRLWDVDEAIFSEAAVEMMARGDLVTPYYNGLLFSHKPPLMYWCQIAAFHLFGLTEFAARLFAPIFSIGTLLVTYEIGRVLFNPRVGMWSGLILAGCVNFTVISRAATPDSPLTFFCTLSLLILILGARARRSTSVSASTFAWQPKLPIAWAYYAGAYVVMAIGTLVKGPVAIVVPMAVWGMFLLIEYARSDQRFAITSNRVDSPTTSECPSLWQRVLSPVGHFFRLFWPPHFFSTLWRMRPLTAMAALLLIAGPWYVAVGIRTNGEFLKEFFLVHNIGRATSAMEHHYGSILFYPITICIGTFPWCILLWPAVTHVCRTSRASTPTQSAYTLIACWCAVWIGCFCLVATKLANYVVPAYPAIALGIGTLVDTWLRDSQSSVYQPWLRRGWRTLAIVGLVISIAVPIVTRTLFSGELSPGLIGLIPISGALVGWYVSSKRQLIDGLKTLAVTSFAFGIGLLAFAAISIDLHKNTHLLAEFIQQHSKVPATIATYKYSPPSLVFYSHQACERLRSRAAVEAYFKHHPANAFLITPEAQLNLLQGYLPANLQVLKTERMFLKCENIVVIGPAPSRGNVGNAESEESRIKGSSTN